MKDLIRFLLIAALSVQILSCCIHKKTKTRPEHTGVDARTKSMVDEYMWMAKMKGIQFNNRVTIGFTYINDGKVVGKCYRMPFFREIDLDEQYWDESNYRARTAVLFHELTHCYCNRDHDYGDGKEYPDKDYNSSPLGRYPDNCPLSIMYPQVVDDECFYAHYSEYIDEMFNRCRPY